MNGYEYRKPEFDDGGKRATMYCEFMIGDEFGKGFRVEVQLNKSRLAASLPATDAVSVAHVRATAFGALSFPNDPDPDPVPDQAEDKAFPNIIQLKWRAEEVMPRRPLHFTLYLENTHALSGDEWRRIVDGITVRFGAIPRYEKVK